MMVSKKYMVRRNLDTYSEMMFASKIAKELKHEVYYPFKDKGIDLVSIDKKNNFYFYQLKARSISKSISKEYWFSVGRVKLNKFKEITNNKRCYWVFCALKGKEQFDFFQIPLKVVFKWYNETKMGRKKKDSYFLIIKPIEKGIYKVAPDRVNKKINIMKYLI